MNYPKLILAVKLEELERQQEEETDAKEIARLQEQIEQTTAAIELIIQHQSK